MADLQVRIEPWGPNPAMLQAAPPAALKHPLVQSHLRGTRHRVLSVAPVDPDAKAGGQPRLPDRYRATIYDYTHNRMLRVDGRLNEPGQLDVAEFARQPIPTSEELAATVRILRRDPDLGPALRARRLYPYQPIPPLVTAEVPNGRVERTLAVGLRPSQRGLRHEIVGVNLIRNTVLRYDGVAPGGPAWVAKVCGSPVDPNQPLGPSLIPPGASGRVRVTVRQGHTVLWRFHVVRPGVSSGTDGSGVELRFVDYRGKRVLYRGHVPIVNVQYDQGDCYGTYRDWTYAEDPFEAKGSDVSPGFRFCPAPAKTILDLGKDAGNFQGVAIYIDGLEVVLVSELMAGAYRYISEWRLHADGTIRPRFGFAATENSCACEVHRHHAYWRFDFDIGTPGNNVVSEFNDPPLVGSSNWETMAYEVRRFRDPAHSRRWRVEHAETGQGYILIPGPNDGVADDFARGDIWLMRYRPTEVDDYPISSDACELDKLADGESIANQDVVVWYGGHFTHDVQEQDEVGHVLGPDLVPFNW